MTAAHTPWTLSCEPLDYLDGIQSGLIVRANNGAPVAYMFDHKQAVLAASAPDLLEALKRIAAAEADHLDGARDSMVLERAIKVAKSAISKATGQ